MLFVNTRTVDWLIACALLIAIVANGTSALLKRVGALDAASYERFIAAYCMPGTALGLASPRCSCMTGAETVALARGLPSAAPEPISRRYVYTTEGYWRFLKPIKDLFFVALLTVGVGVAIRRCGYLTRWRAAPLPWALLASVLLAAGVSVVNWGAMLAIVGARPFIFLLLALLGAWLLPHLRMISMALFVALLLQLGVAAWEFLRGIPLTWCDGPFRAAGTFALPNTLGMFAATVPAFLWVFMGNTRWFWMSLAAAIALIFASSSGTGVAALGAMGCYFAVDRVYRRFATHTRFIGAIAAVVIALSGLALTVASLTLLQRPAIFSSVFAPEGRLDGLLKSVERASPLATVFGQGLGYGTNASLTVLKDAPEAMPRSSTGEAFSADSMVTSLFIQMGAVGVALYFGLLAWAFWVHQRARPLYVVLAVSSVVLNVNETFPVNLMLALALSATFYHVDKTQKLSIRPIEYGVRSTPRPDT